VILGGMGGEATLCFTGVDFDFALKKFLGFVFFN
jgi:hypothetical protein